MTFEEAKTIQQACLDHTGELLTVAGDILARHPHLAYHLSAFALEEIGKVDQVRMVAVPVTHPLDKKPPLSESDDHVHKLFWAI
jgi:AbiV family abortive infection protein